MEESNFNLAEFDWSVLYVSMLDLGTGLFLLTDLSLLKGFWIANKGTSVTRVPRTPVLPYSVGHLRVIYY